MDDLLSNIDSMMLQVPARKGSESSFTALDYFSEEPMTPSYGHLIDDLMATAPIEIPSGAHVHLEPIDATFAKKTLLIEEEYPVYIGRCINDATMPKSDNGYFDCKGLSRVHAELTFAGGQVRNY